MHTDIPPSNTSSDGRVQPWFGWTRELSRYHWFVLVVAALGWLFDTMDQQLFVLAREPAMSELLAVPPGDPLAKQYGGYATSIFLIGWASGGIAFGVLGDRIGRAKTMVLTILIYSLCTGLSAISVGFWDFALYRFLTGLGVGGEFAVGVALVAEVLPERARPFALGLLQALSAVGNIMAALITLFLGHLEEQGVFHELFIFGYGPVSAWRIMFVIGTLPALLAILIRRRLKEPERWKAVAATELSRKQLGSYAELFGNPRWRRHALAGLLLAFAGVVGLWGIGFYAPALFSAVFRQSFEAQGMTKLEIEGQITQWRGVTMLLLNAGAFFGIYGFSLVSHYLGRKNTFVLSFLLAMFSTAFTFWSFSELSDVFWMIPLMGFCQLSVFGGYAIYFPELFPTRLRSTGTSFCYNVGRLVAAAGPTALGLLTGVVYAGFAEPLPIRYAGLTMCSVFLLGLVALPFLPETKGKPLPE